MAHYGTLRDYRFSDAETADDVRGSRVYGRDDEKLGKIDDVIFDHTSGNIQYVVIDTGGWLSSKKFIVPPQGLHASAKHKDDFQMGASKKQVEAFPPYHEDDVSDEDRWKDYKKRYQAAWHDDRSSIVKVQIATSPRHPMRCQPSRTPSAASSPQASRRDSLPGDSGR